jgi:glucose-1-phosphate adenylyltransferase
VPRAEASRFGLVHTDADGRVRAFEEKPADPTIDMASMGIYAFRPEALAELLAADARDPASTHDFGHDIIPQALAGGARVCAYTFDGYWRDVGTIEAYWDAHVEFLLDTPLPLQQVATRAQALPPAQVSRQACVHHSLVAPGTAVHGLVERSVLSPGVSVGPGAVVRDSILLPGARIGAGASVERTIVDEGAEIGAHARLGLGGTDAVAGGRAELLVNGLNVVGERAQIPPYFTVFRNTMVGAHVDHLTRGGSLPAGGTVLARSPAGQRAPLLAS